MFRQDCLNGLPLVALTASTTDLSRQPQDTVLTIGQMVSIQPAPTPKFLIDASVFPGSSGSPVFIYYTGSYPDKAGNLYAGSRMFFLGILAQVFQRTEQGDIKIKEVPTAQVAITEVQQMIDLGIVFNDSTVIECLNNYLTVVGSDPSTTHNTDRPTDG